jgi:hypothetical protein
MPERWERRIASLRRCAGKLARKFRAFILSSLERRASGEREQQWQEAHLFPPVHAPQRAKGRNRFRRPALYDCVLVI